MASGGLGSGAEPAGVRPKDLHLRNLHAAGRHARRVRVLEKHPHVSRRRGVREREVLPVVQELHPERCDLQPWPAWGTADQQLALIWRGDVHSLGLDCDTRDVEGGLQVEVEKLICLRARLPIGAGGVVHAPFVGVGGIVPRVGNDSRTDYLGLVRPLQAGQRGGHLAGDAGEAIVTGASEMAAVVRQPSTRWYAPWGCGSANTTRPCQRGL
eukprot:128417-Prorocentrum_minimum.AAC.2